MKPNPLHSWLKSYYGSLGNSLERFLETLESCPVTIAGKPAGTFEALHDVIELHPNQWKTFKQALQLEADTLQSIKGMGLDNYKAGRVLSWADRVHVIGQVLAWLELLEQGMEPGDIRAAWECTKKLMGIEEKPDPFEAARDAMLKFGMSAIEVGNAIRDIIRPRPLPQDLRGQFVPYPKKDDPQDAMPADLAQKS